jgi:hypothetical protein
MLMQSRTCSVPSHLAVFVLAVARCSEATGTPDIIIAWRTQSSGCRTTSTPALCNVTHPPRPPLRSSPDPSIADIMSSIIGRTALRAAPRLRATAVPRRFDSTQATAHAQDRQASKNAIKDGAKRDPELYVRDAVLAYWGWGSISPGECM